MFAIMTAMALGILLKSPLCVSIIAVFTDAVFGWSEEFETASSGSWWQDFAFPQGIFTFTAVRGASARTTACVGRCLCLQAQVFDNEKICYWSHTDTFYSPKQFVYFQVGKIYEVDLATSERVLEWKFNDLVVFDDHWETLNKVFKQKKPKK